MFGLSSEKLLILLLLAVFILGPERLPQYTRQFAQFIKKLRRMANSAQDQMKEELGDGFEDLDWKKLDPRQYDPRRIIREALLEDEPAVKHADLNQVRSKAQPNLAPGEYPPHDI
ncbi:MAG: Sec-independent protein translocase TatB, partial [Rhodoluna sp.]